MYFLLLLGLGAAVLNYLYGDFIIMRADGLVLRHKSVIAATYVARVQSVAVREGQEVVKGELLLDLLSTEMLDRLADLSSRRAQQSEQRRPRNSYSAGLPTACPGRKAGLPDQQGAR